MMRRSCLLQLLLFALVVGALAMSLQRLLAPVDAPDRSDVAQPTAEPSPERPARSLGQSFRMLVAPQADEDRSEESPRDVEIPLAPTGIEGLALHLSQPLMIEISHLGGLAADADSYYVSGSDVDRRVGLLFQVSRTSHTISQMRTIVEGDRYRLGGVHVGSGYLWAPIAGDDPAAPSLVLGIEAGLLRVSRRIETSDRISAVAELGSSVYGLSEASSRIYEWSREGQLLRAAELSTGATYVDMEVVRDSLVCTGHDAAGGVIDVLDPASLTLLVRHRCHTATAEGAWVTSGGFAYRDEVFYFLPQPGKFPLLLSYTLNETALEQFVPSTGT